MNDSNSWFQDFVPHIRDIEVIAGFDQHWYPQRKIDSHSHEYYQMDYFYDGRGVVAIGDTAYTLRTGDLFIYNPKDTHSYKPDQEKPMGNVTLKFTLGGEYNLVFPSRIANLALLSRDQRRDMEAQLSRACVEANKPGEDSLLLATSFLHVFFALLISYLKYLDNLSSGTDPDRCLMVQEYIKKHYDRQISLQDLANIAGVHPKYLCQQFSVTTGCPPMQYLSQIRIESAKRLLINTVIPVSEVALRVGYLDIAYFSNRFKQITGKSPSAYRKAKAAEFHQ